MDLNSAWRKVSWYHLSILVLATFAFTLKGGFLSWDDDRNIAKNLLLLQNQLAAFWEKPYFGMYIPLSYSTWGLLWQSGIQQAWQFHGLNVLVHLCNVLLVFTLFRKCTTRLASFWIAAVFAIHPLQTETVAWISGGRDLFSVFWILQAVHANLSSRPWLRWSSCLFFALGLLCKPAVITVSLALWVWKLSTRSQLDWKSFWQLSLEYLPWLAVSLPILWITQVTQAEAFTYHVGAWLRPLVMIDAYGFYLLKFLWPFQLNVDYGRTPRWLLENFSSSVLPSFLCLGFASLAIWKKTKTAWRAPVLIYFALLLPVSGIVTFAFQEHSTVTDHYVYLALPILAWGLQRQWQSMARIGGRLSFAAATLALFVWAALTFHRSEVWNNDEALYGSIVRENPASFIGQTGLGIVFLDRNDLQNAKSHFFAAFDLHPDWLTAVANKYLILQKLGQSEEVARLDSKLDLNQYTSIGKAQPEIFSDLLTTVAAGLYSQGQVLQSFQRICQALRYNPKNTVAQESYQILQARLASQNSNPQCPP